MTLVAGAFASPAGVGPEPDRAEVIADLVLAVAGVAGLHGGTYGHVATYLPGRAVTGVRTGIGSTDVHLVAVWGAEIPALADRIRARLEPLLGHPVHIAVEDVTDPDQTGIGQTVISSNPPAKAPMPSRGMPSNAVEE